MALFSFLAVLALFIHLILLMSAGLQLDQHI
jgi:hypothetical protein